MHLEIVSEYDQEIPLLQTEDKPMVLGIPWHWEEEPHNNHETLGRQTKKNNQLSLPHQDDCRSVFAHLCIQQTHTDFTYICAVVNEVIVKLRPQN